jgi:hypothetical protein
MGSLPPAEYNTILQQVRTWLPELRLNLAEALLQSLHSNIPPVGRHGVPVERVLGMTAGKGPPPDDGIVRQWIDEYLREQY